nr:hypothetical protein GCM10025699_42330 [Microbacterium flavescens]
MQSTRTSFRLPFALAVGVASAVALAGCSTADEPSPTIGADDLAELLPTLDEVVAATDVDGAAGTWTLARSSSDAGTSSPSGVSADGGPADGDLGLCAMDFRSLTSDRSLPSATAVFTRDRQQFTTGVVSRDDADAYVDALRDELEGARRRRRRVSAARRARSL